MSAIHKQFVKAILLWGIFFNLISVGNTHAESDNKTIAGENVGKSPSLEEVLANTIARGYAHVDDLPDYQSSTWLAASPTVRLSYLSSQEDFGSDEAEFSLNLSIKSGLQREIDRQLIKVNKDIRLQQSELRKLYFSGLIRETVWSYEIAKANETYIQKKLSVLKQLENNNELLVVAGEVSDYGLLLVKKETINTQIKALENQQELKKWRIQYQAISGMINMPKIMEKKTEISELNVSQHPEVLLLASSWQQQKLMIKENSSDAEPWMLSASAKTVDTLGVQDQQLGLSFELPLSFVEVNSQSIANQSLQSKVQFDLEYQKNYLKINQQLTEHSESRHFLIKKQSLLQDSLKLSKKIMQQIEHLKARNEMGQELVLRRVIDAMEIQNDNAVINLLIQQNNSLLRQAAGIPL